jgi:lipopolysaccharide assembly outer membrane protein LptD (OstA)
MYLLQGLFPEPAAGQVPETDAPEEGPDTSRPVSFSARDSLTIDFGEQATQSNLNGQASVSSGETRITAHTIALDLSTKQMRAEGARRDTGWVGLPHFERGQESFDGEVFEYNFQSRKGRIVEARTAIEQGQVRGEIIKQPSDSVFFIQGATYTTCPCREDPQYHFRANRMKILNQEWIFTGPIHLRLFNIPLPVWLPFGFLPAQETRRSGFLPPSYGEDQRGFYLRDWGWYWAINPYMDLQARFGIWTRGSWQVAPRFRYSKRYNYSGALSLDWVRNKRGESADPDYTVVDSRSLRWNHNQTINPTTRLSGNVNLSSRGYLRTVSRDYDDRVRQDVSSTINFNKRWSEQGRSLSLSARQSQQLATGNTSLTLPNLSFSQQSRRPFQHDSPQPGGEAWYEKITYSYRGRVQNRYRFNPRTDLPDSLREEISWWNGLFSPDDYRRATGDDERFDFTTTHSVPVSASFSINRLPLIGRVPFNFSPRIDYGEDWYISTERRRGSDSTDRVETVSIPGFFSYRHLSTSMNANTEFYGTFPWRLGPFDGFRHVVRPSWSLTYRPDYSSDFWGYYRSYTDANGNRRQYPIVSGIPRGQQQTVSFNLTNVFQSKYISSDTTGQTSSRTLQLLTLDLNTRYNFAADSLGLAPISLSSRTRLLDRFDINASATLSPYATNPQGRVIGRYLWQNGEGLVRMTNFRVSTRTTFGGQLQRSPSTTANGGPRQPGPGSRQMQRSRFGQMGRGTTDRWSLSLSGNYSYSRNFGQTQERAVLNTQFTFPVTGTISVSGNTGYDFMDKELVYTSININRQLRCWNMGLHWIPFGRGQSFQFSLQVNSSQLSDLLHLQIPQSDMNDRFGQLRR